MPSSLGRELELGHTARGRDCPNCHAMDYEAAAVRAECERLRKRMQTLELLVKAAPDYLGARQALHNHWIDEAAKAVGELGASLPVSEGDRV